MLRCFLWLLILLALPGVARADGADGSTSIQLDGVPAAQPAEASAPAVPALDLDFDLDLSKGGLAGVRGIRPVAPRAGTDSLAPEVEAPFSVGFDIKAQRELGSPAIRATADSEDPQTLTDNVEGVVKRSTFGLKGTYRF